MRVEFVSPAAVTPEQLDRLVLSFAAGPVFEYRFAWEINALLQGETHHLYRVGEKDGLMLTHVDAQNGLRRLVLDAAYGKGLYTKSWLQALQQLATEWTCDTIQTIAYNRRLARAIVLAGAEQEAIVLTFKLETGRG